VCHCIDCCWGQTVNNSEALWSTTTTGAVSHKNYRLPLLRGSSWWQIVIFHKIYILWNIAHNNAHIARTVVRRVLFACHMHNMFYIHRLKSAWRIVCRLRLRLTKMSMQFSRYSSWLFMIFYMAHWLRSKNVNIFFCHIHYYIHTTHALSPKG
jgi:hypothetical protein